MLETTLRSPDHTIIQFSHVLDQIYLLVWDVWYYMKYLIVMNILVCPLFRDEFTIFTYKTTDTMADYSQSIAVNVYDLKFHCWIPWQFIFESKQNDFHFSFYFIVMHLFSRMYIIEKINETKIQLSIDIVCLYEQNLRPKKKEY